MADQTKIPAPEPFSAEVFDARTAEYVEMMVITLESAETYAEAREAAAVAAERERCAALCEELFSFGALEIAAAIRAG